MAWDPVLDPNPAGYRVYYGTSSKSYQFSTDAGNNTAITIPNLQDGITYYFAATAYDSAGHESDYSNEICVNAAATCSYAILPVSQSIGSSGGVGTVRISSPPGCTWTAVNNVSWVIITSNSSGTGNGMVNYSVSPNTSISSRRGALTVAGQRFTLTQSGRTEYPLRIAKKGNGAGTISNIPAGKVFELGTLLTLTATPDDNSIFVGWSGRCSGNSPMCTITMNSGTLVNGTFKLKTHVITASAGANGSISPSGPVALNHGGSQRFTFMPSKGYQIANIKVDGISVGRPSSFLFGNIRDSHRIDATFIPLRQKE